MPPVRSEVDAAPTRRSNRLRAAAQSTSTTSDVDSSPTPIVETVLADAVVAEAVVALADAVVAPGETSSDPVDAARTAPLSRRARRLARTGPSQVVSADADDTDTDRAPSAATVAAAMPETATPVAEPELLTEPELQAEQALQAEPEASRPELQSVHPQVSQSTADAFTLASDAFGFSPVDDSAPASASAATDQTAPTAQHEQAEPIAASGHVAPRRIRRRITAAAASLGVMGVAGLIAVSMTVPAGAITAVQQKGSAATASLVAADAPAKKVADDEIQAYVASSDVQDEALVRDSEYSTVSLMDVAAEEGIKRVSDSLYTNDPNAAIQWPFMVGVAMSSPYGMRNGRMHAGIDLVPGAGATIQAIADGTVRKATESGGGYGVTVYVDHIIDGQVVTSHYSHMQHGSLAVRTGQKVKVGDPIGKVGNTGRSYGAHLHFEIIINGSTVNPLTWMRANAGRYSY
ncbi:M23 family metallopeptidase [Microbacterium sp. ARD32]|uniref:M23 family metallopeptidase n=1 Tax=Microbacterium sp. ARD32 TaxID=2962577 RepID=UPI002882366B|nr:M23 family metallopeptidase [Microbacterium sp. ARD32]MDT0156319.1 M23 family metallopeptidase [Microbacterium sp. ARD32]